MSLLELFAALVVAHALCDYPLQGDFLARAKNPAAPLPVVPWQWAMGAHAAIHGGGVWCCTGSFALGVAEGVMHWIIDYGKCRGFLSFAADQGLHILCKAVWVGMLAVLGGAS